MPCNDGGVPYPHYDPDSARLQRRNDELTAENDQLREALLELIDNPHMTLPKELRKQVAERQAVHRKEDLTRLEDTFVRSKDLDRLAKVWHADPHKPLEPQLGFNPDDF